MKFLLFREKFDINPTFEKFPSALLLPVQLKLKKKKYILKIFYFVTITSF